mgnify:CR=1 FL=1
METLLQTQIAPLLSSFYHYDIVYLWLFVDLQNRWLLEGWDKCLIERVLVLIWHYVLINKELWRGLNFIGLSSYEVSTFGRLHNIRTNYITRGSKVYDGYDIVSPFNDQGKVIRILLHRLIAFAFLDNPEQKPTVDHIDRNKDNNHVLNLRWATHGEQQVNKKHGPKTHSEKYTGNLPNEEWVSVPYIEWKDIYVSNLGRIVRKDGRLLIGSVKNGYRSITIAYRGSTISKYLHRLVMASFHGINDELDVNHKNGVKTDNRLDNLEYVTRVENTKHARQLGLITEERGGGKRVNQLTVWGNVIATFRSTREAGRITGVIHAHISAVCRGERHTAGGFRWQYTDY